MPISGNNGTVRKGSTVYNVSGWTLDIEGLDKDGSTTEFAGEEIPVAVGVRRSGSIEYFFEPTIGMPFAPNDDVTLTLNLTSTHSWSGPALMGKTSIKSKVMEVTTMSTSFKSKGIWTYT